MFFHETLIALLVVALPALATLHTLERDIVIIGGGAAGSHAAVRLRDDFGKSVVLVEKESVLVCRDDWPISCGAIIN